MTKSPFSSLAPEPGPDDPLDGGSMVAPGHRRCWELAQPKPPTTSGQDRRFAGLVSAPHWYDP